MMYRAVPAVQPLESRTHLHAGEDHELAADNFAVNAGGAEYVDSTGLTWEADRGFSATKTAKTKKITRPIADTALDTVFQSARQDYDLHWASDVPNGTYSVSLYFAEQDYAKIGERVFDINLQGRRKVAHFDIVRESGGKDTAVVRTFTVRVSDNHLVVDLPTGRERASLSAVRVQPAETASSVAAGTLNWQTKKNAPTKLEESVSFVANKKLYTVGGYVNGAFAATTRVDAYDPKSNTWARKKNAPTKLTHAGVAVDEGRHTVWLMGGFIGDFPDPSGTRTVWRYDYARDTWKKGPNLPVARGGGGGAIVDNKLYYFSGATADRSGDSGASYVLDLGAKTPAWKPIAALPSPRNHFGTVTVGNKVFVIGGQTGLEARSVSVGSTYVYNTSTNKWSRTTSLPVAYSHFTSTISLYKDRYVVLAGGENPHNTALDYVYLFDAETRRWTKLTKLPGVRRAAAGGIIGDTYVVTGGFVYKKNQLDTTWTTNLGDLGL